MKYDRLEKAKNKAEDDLLELNSLAADYARSDSMEEFRLKACADGNEKSKFMKWFRLFYFVKNHRIYDAFPWLVVVPLGILAVIGIGVCVEFMSHYSKSGGWQGLCALVFVVSVSVACLLLLVAFRRISSSLEKVKDAVWAAGE